MRATLRSVKRSSAMIWRWSTGTEHWLAGFQSRDASPTSSAWHAAGISAHGTTIVSAWSRDAFGVTTRPRSSNRTKPVAGPAALPVEPDVFRSPESRRPADRQQRGVASLEWDLWAQGVNQRAESSAINGGA